MALGFSPFPSVAKSQRGASRGKVAQCDLRQRPWEESGLMPRIIVNIYLLRTYCVPVTEDTIVNQRGKAPALKKQHSS